MYAVYLCGPTDCFLHALFMNEFHAEEWASSHNYNPEGYKIVYWACASDVDKSSTGWQGF